MTLNDRVKIPEEVLFQNVGDETVLLNLESESYYGLDPVGSRMWELLAQHGSLRAVFETVAEEYDVCAEELEHDLVRLLDELCAKGLVEVVG